jgi:hypothetical protein
MLDNVLLDYYLDSRSRADLKRLKSQKSHAASVAVEVLKGFREDLRSCMGEIAELQGLLASEGFMLTPVRILEVLIWTEVEPQGYYRK